MRINTIDNKTFQTKPFRLMAEELTYTRLGSSLVNFKKPSKYVMEYKNPRAEELYKKAQNTRDFFKKVSLYEQMGEYELKSLNFKELIEYKFDKFLSKILIK